MSLISANYTQNSEKSWISFLNNRDDGKNTHTCAGLFKPEDLKTLNHQKIYVVILFQHWMIHFLPLSSFFVCVSVCVFVCHPLSSVCMCDIHNVISSPATFQVTIFLARSSLCPDHIAVYITRLFLGYYLILWYGTWWEAWKWY